MTVLVIAEHDNSKLAQSTLNTLSAAKQLGDIEVVALGAGCASVVEQLQQYPVKGILVADDPALATPLAETFAQVISPLIKDYSHVLAPATTFGKNLLPRIAGMNQLAQVSDVTEVVDEQTYRRPIYAGNAIETVELMDSPQLVTVRPSAFECAEKAQSSPQIKPVNASLINVLSKYLKADFRSTDRPQLDSSELVISGGRGLKNKTEFERLMKIADRMGAAIGATRAAVDAGFAPNDFQVGQTGHVIAPKLYIAVGISGAIQHLAGMKDSRFIVAINKDPDAPIFEVADLGLVADINDVLPQWEAWLDSKNNE